MNSLTGFRFSARDWRESQKRHGPGPYTVWYLTHLTQNCFVDAFVIAPNDRCKTVICMCLFPDELTCLWDNICLNVGIGTQKENQFFANLFRQPVLDNHLFQWNSVSLFQNFIVVGSEMLELPSSLIFHQLILGLLSHDFSAVIIDRYIFEKSKHFTKWRFISVS